MLPAKSAISAKPNLDNFHVPINVPPTRNALYPIRQSPNAKPTLVLPTPNKVMIMWPQSIRYFQFFFLVLYSSSYKNLLPSALFCNSAKGDCPLHEMLKFPLPKLFLTLLTTIIVKNKDRFSNI